VVKAFLGRLTDPLPSGSGPGKVGIDSALRAIMFTDLKGSTEMTTRLGEAKALHLLRVHNVFTRNCLKDHAGREVKHLGDGIMASFASIPQALDCAISIQKALASFNESNAETPLHLRIGLSAGEPVESDNDLFGATVQLAARLCAQAQPDQILGAEDFIRRHPGDGSLFSELGPITLKGFDQPIRVYEVHWRES
jgi:class 3 adenylate cyclase